MKFSLIAAIDRKNGIAKNGEIPWYISEDLKFFKEMTIGDGKKQNVVIMGRLTWESLPKKFRPLKNRLNLIISSQKIEDHDLVFGTLDEALDYVDIRQDIGKIFVVGGQRLYEEAIYHRYADLLYLTHVDKEYDCDRFFPQIDKNKYKIVGKSLIKFTTEDGIKYTFVIYKRISI